MNIKILKDIVLLILIVIILFFYFSNNNIKSTLNNKFSEVKQYINDFSSNIKPKDKLIEQEKDLSYIEDQKIKNKELIYIEEEIDKLKKEIAIDKLNNPNKIEEKFNIIEDFSFKASKKNTLYINDRIHFTKEEEKRIKHRERKLLNEENNLYQSHFFKNKEENVYIKKPINDNKIKTKKIYNYRCRGKTHCSHMSSCAEAKFYINNCPNTKMDGDKDGIPCERQWCH